MCVDSQVSKGRKLLKPSPATLKLQKGFLQE